MKHTDFPSTGFLRLAQIVGNPKANPPIPAVLPISRSTFLSGVKSGRYPLEPIKLSERCTAYKVEEVLALLDQLAGEEKQCPSQPKRCSKVKQAPNSSGGAV